MTHTVPRPIGVVMRRSPDGLVVVSVSSVSAVESLFMISLAVPNSISPCSVSTRPRAWRWNSETFSSFSSADTCRLTADWLMRSDFTRMGEAAGLGGGMKDAELVPVHGR